MDINLNLNFKNNFRKIKIDLILIAILSVSILLRFYNLGFQGAWLDELHTLKEADPNLTLKEFHQIIMFREGIPHFYFLVVRFFGIIFGYSLYTIRLVSVVSGVLAVYGAFLLGKSMVDKQTGYIAAFLLAVHPFLIEYSQEGRSYEMLAMFLIFSVYRLVLFVEKPTLKNAIYLGIFSGLITNAQPIAIISVLGIYLTVCICFLFLKTKKDRIIYIKWSFISGIVTLLVFSPVYMIADKVSKSTSHWVPKATYDYTINVLQQVAGGNLLLILSILSLLLLIIPVIIGLVKKKGIPENKIFLNFIIVFIWIVFFSSFAIIKSYYGLTSLMLPRYFISIAPAFVITIALLISQFKNFKIRLILTLIMASVFLYNLFIQRDYYNTRVKSQFDVLGSRILNENIYKETIVSNWGWLMGFYLDRDNTNKNVFENNLDNYINDVKTNSVDQENFWYVDGNSRPYSVTPETQEFLEQNYTLEKSIDLFDCWAKHYVSKKAVNENDKSIKLNKFSNAQFDGSGNLMFFENSKSTYIPVFLSKGKYKLTIKGKSFPDPKIDNENAKLKIYLNQKNYKIIELSEKELSDYELEYKQEVDGNLLIAIEFINDFSKNKFDRNAMVSNINLKKTDF